MSEERVYVIGTPGSNTVKIGRTIHLEKRLAEIQRMSPVQLEVLWSTPGGHALETALHRHFRARRSHGEWFAFDGDPVEAVTRATDEKAQENEQARRRCSTGQPKFVITRHMRGAIHVEGDDEVAQIA